MLLATPKGKMVYKFYITRVPTRGSLKLLVKKRVCRSSRAVMAASRSI